MRMSHTNYKNVIEGLGGDPMRFLLLLVHTLNVFINKFASGARNFFLIFQCHTVTNGTDLRRSPPGGAPLGGAFFQGGTFSPVENAQLKSGGL